MTADEIKPGMRVKTQHGPGTVDAAEFARCSWPGEVPERRQATGRYSVVLDTWPFAWVGTAAAYWPREMEAI